MADVSRKKSVPLLREKKRVDKRKLDQQPNDQVQKQQKQQSDTPVLDTLDEPDKKNTKYEATLFEVQAAIEELRRNRIYDEDEEDLFRSFPKRKEPAYQAAWEHIADDVKLSDLGYEVEQSTKEGGKRGPSVMLDFLSTGVSASHSATKNNHAGVTLADESSDEHDKMALVGGLGGSGLASKLKHKALTEQLAGLKGRDLKSVKSLKSHNKLVNKVGSKAEMFGQAAKVLGLAGEGLKAMDAMNNLRNRSGDSKDLNALSIVEDGIVSKRGAGWYRRVKGRNSSKKIVQGLKLLGAALGIAGILATGPIAGVLAIAGMVVGLGVVAGKWLSKLFRGKRRVAVAPKVLDDNGSDDVDEKDDKLELPNVDQLNQLDDGKEDDKDDGKKEDKEQVVEETSKVEEPTSYGRTRRLGHWLIGGNKEERASKRGVRDDRKASKKRFAKERKARIKTAKELRGNQKKLAKTNKLYSKTWAKWKDAEEKNDTKKAKKLLGKLQTLKNKQAALKTSGLPSEDVQSLLLDASHMVEDNRACAIEMVEALAVGNNEPKSDNVEDKEHHDAEVLVGVLGVSIKEAGSSSGQELVERRLSAFDGV